jgi:hypothetical protein
MIPPSDNHAVVGGRRAQAVFLRRSRKPFVQSEHFRAGDLGVAIRLRLLRAAARKKGVELFAVDSGHVFTAVELKKYTTDMLKHMLGLRGLVVTGRKDDMILRLVASSSSLAPASEVVVVAEAAEVAEVAEVAELAEVAEVAEVAELAEVKEMEAGEVDCESELSLEAELEEQFVDADLAEESERAAEMEALVEASAIDSDSQDWSEGRVHRDNNRRRVAPPVGQGRVEESNILSAKRVRRQAGRSDGTLLDS